MTPRAPGVARGPGAPCGAGWRSRRRRGLVVAAVVFAAVGAGLIRAQSQVVARDRARPPGEPLAKLVSTQAEQAATGGAQVTFFAPDQPRGAGGPRTRLYYTGLP